MNNEKELFASWYVTAFLDVLGNQEAIKALSELPNTSDPEDKERFYSAIAKSYGVVRKVRDGVNRFVSNYENIDALDTIAPDLRERYLQLRSSYIKFYSFSDCITIFHTLRNDIILVPFGAIFGILGACGSEMLVGLAMGHAMRGGIEIGVGIEIDDAEIYGPALVEAYKLESKTAIYPRLVIGKRLYEHIESSKEIQGTSQGEILNRQLATRCSEMICKDFDGVYILDYLGQGYIDNVSKKLDPKIFDLALSFIAKELEKYKRDENSYVFRKYHYLSEYFSKKRDFIDRE